MIVEILGSELPGLRCGPASDGSFYENIHVGLARRTETVDLVPGDADSARWVFEVTVRDRDDGIGYHRTVRARQAWRPRVRAPVGRSGGRWLVRRLPGGEAALL